MEIGFAVPVSGSWATVDNLARVATRAEDLGYRSLWTMQRLLSPPDANWGEAYRTVLDPVATLSFLAARTSRVRLGAAVLNMPFFAPALLAKQLATVDILSGGRLDAGLGIGWSDEEYAAVGADKARRGKRADEYLPLLRRFWTDDVIEHEGEFYRVPPSRMDPKPVQPGGPPILLGAGAEAALRRAGRLADGWVSSSRADLTAIGDSVRTIREAAEQAGRDPNALRVVCRGAVRVRPDAGDRRPLTGSVEQIRDDFGALAAQGVTEVFIDLNFDAEIGTPDADPAASMDRAEAALEAFAP
ncbi:TIGR03619 family F420-dependent LLM class oxidoreductase [Actinokineospora auranticolor]|uniref:Putative F420-dependent oxidoreductase n=1 Tax=Actinokineospora auranticolor TaxID=155976 RepID=A0A2S6GCC0_9PSEU|nr:TIGR03619 family F420-dependent LLM class oxidoreductase [Actinokineospora auranticolor]PPK62207.1 putative F420-dependent oxidoreductase [Actinokineospora auranticolor]